jgi:hypothetical protein
MTSVHQRAERLLERELERFVETHPLSGELARRASASLLAGVPMHWMLRWPGAYPCSPARPRARASGTAIDRDESDVGGIGGTLAANVLSLAAVRATLEHVLTGPVLRPHDRARRTVRAGRPERHRRAGAPVALTRLGCRVEYLFRPERPVTGSDAAAGGDHLLDRLIHLYALNRGVLLTPFHNMALMSPATTEADVDLHTAVFGAIARELT